MGFEQGLGIELEQKGTLLLCHATVSEAHINLVGRPHGGLVFSMADTAMGGTLQGHLPSGKLTASVQVSVSMVAAPRIGERITATARVVHHGKSLAVCEARVESAGAPGRLYATGTGTFAILDLARVTPPEA